MNERLRSIIDRPWKAIVMESGDRHVVPLFDLKEHNTLSHDCHCQPEVSHCLGGCHTFTVHRSYDGREVLERALGKAWAEKN